jgi:hypothetical protein
MKKLAAVLIALAALRGCAALAQQPPPPKSEVSDDLRLMCREAARKICNPGIPPDRQAFRRCAAENRDKLRARCSAPFAAMGQPRPQDA